MIVNFLFILFLDYYGLTISSAVVLDKKSWFAVFYRFGMTEVLTLNICLIHGKFRYFGEGSLIYNYLQDACDVRCGAHGTGPNWEHTCLWREDK